jgi:hypothetical protein
MNYVAAHLLLYMTTYDAFITFIQLMQLPKYNMKGLYMPDLPGLKESIFVHTKLME